MFNVYVHIYKRKSTVEDTDGMVIDVGAAGGAVQRPFGSMGAMTMRHIEI